MKFADLYRAVEAAGAKPAAFEFLRETVIENLSWLEEVVVWRLTHKPPTGEARFTLFDDLLAKVDEMNPLPAKRGPYKKTKNKLENSGEVAASAKNSN